MADIRKNKWEWFHYDNPDFQVQYRKNNIPANVKFPAMELHWHDDVEFIYIEEGSVLYEMEDEMIRMQKGEGIFVNARQLHLIHADDCDCELHCLIFHPIILCSSEYITSDCVVPLLEDSSVPYVFLSETVPWQKQLLMDIRDIGPYTESAHGKLTIMKYIYDIWDLLFQNLVSRPEEEDKNQNLSSVKKMVAYIQKNYRNKILLSDICMVGNVGKTKCSALFDMYYNMSPMEYVRNYRIEKGAKLLEITDMSITEIAYEIGLSDGSYFAKVFGQLIGCSPQQYRSYGRGMSRYYEVRRFPNLQTGVQDTDYSKSDL